MMKDDTRLVINSNKLWVFTHLFIAGALLVAAAVFRSKDTFLAGLFAVVAVTNVTMSFLAHRLSVTLDGTTLEVQDYLTKKTMDISKLVSAGVGRGPCIYMRNDQGHNLSIPFKFNKNDLAILVSRLQPYIMTEGVKRDKHVEKFMAKYIA